MIQRLRGKQKYIFIVFLCFTLSFTSKTYSQNSTNDSLIKRFELSSDENLKLQTAIEIAKLNYKTDSTLYLKYASEALLLSEKLDDNYQKGKLCLDLGYFYIDRNIFKALEYANKCLTIFKELDSAKYESQTYTLFGSIYYYSGNYSKSFENYFQSLKINEQLKNEEDLPIDYNNLAIIYSEQKNNKKALEYYFKALNINKKYKKSNSSSGTLMNLSITYGDIDSIDLELKYGKMAFDSAKKYEDQEMISHTLICLGYTYAKLKDFDKAEKYYAEAETILIKEGSKYFLNYLYSSKGQLYKEKGNISKAIDYYKLTLKNAQKDDIPALVQDASLELSKIHKAQNQFKEGLFYHEIYHNISDSIFNIEKTKTITELELQYEFDKQMKIKREESEAKQKILSLQRKIIIFSISALILTIGIIILIIRNYRSKQKSYLLLSKQNLQIQKQSDEIKEQRDQLKQLNATKDKINSIIAHDLKSPFTAILGFGSLLMESWDSSDDNSRKLLLAEMNNSANNAYDLLDNLLEWSRSQTGTIRVDPKCIEVRKHIDQTIVNVIGYAKEKRITISNKVDQAALIKADVNMLGTVIRNLLTNAIKFTNTGGTIIISNRSEANGNIAIEIADNGVGMSDEIMASLFNIETQVSTFGTNNEKGTGLGLLICRDFVEKNEGSFDVESQLGVGSKFIITLPAYQLNCN